jgi:acyl dehydratase
VPLTVHVRDLPGMSGRHLGYSAWHEITQRQVDQFAEATWDHQWIHVDPERAADGPYGGTIAHGFLTISLAPALMAEIWRVEGIDVTVNHGLGALSLRSPVPVGAQVRMGAQISATRPRPRGFVEVTFRLTFECAPPDQVDRAQRVATADLVLLLHTVDADQAAVPVDADPASKVD